MSLVDVFTKRATEFQMDAGQVRALGAITLSPEQEEALTVLISKIEAEEWDSGYDDAMIDTLAPKNGGGK